MRQLSFREGRASRSELKYSLEVKGSGSELVIELESYDGYNVYYIGSPVSNCRV